MMVLVVVVFTVAGFVLGSVSRKQGMKLPRWIEKKVPQATSKPDTSDLPSWKSLVFTGVILAVVYSWFIVNDSIL